MKSWLIIAVLCLAGCSGTAPVGRSNVTSEPLAPEPVDATVEYGEAVSGGSESELLYQLLVGEIAGQEGAYEEAVSHYLAAARLAEDPDLAQRAAKIALYARDEIGALAAAEYWRELAPETLEVHQLLANLYVRAGDQVGALGALESALQLAGDTPNYTMLIELLTQFPDPRAAAQVLSGLLQQRGDDPVALLTAAALMLRTKEYPAAETLLLDVLRRWPDQVPAAELYTELLVQQRRLDEAQAFLQARLTTDPELTVLRL